MENIFRSNWLEIDLGAYGHNVRVMKRFIGDNVKLCAVVKADAYGHGATEIAGAALQNGADVLAVALVEEGIHLRRNGIEAPILLLSEPEEDGIREAVRNALTLTIYTPDGALKTAKAYKAYKSQVSSAKIAGSDLYGDLLPIQIMMDTGMHRVGVSEIDLPSLLDTVFSSRVLKITGFWSHLAVADDSSNPFTNLQLNKFNNSYQQLLEPLCRKNGSNIGENEKIILHIANSAGTIYHKSARLDMVRLGIALYGYPPMDMAGQSLEDKPEPLSQIIPVLSWKAKVHLTREVPKGEAVSYGLLHPLEANSIIAVIPAGYHDGIPRSLFRAGGQVLINGVRRRIIGQVTMDQIMVDCGEDSEVRPGDEVVILGSQGGENITAEEWAAKLNTISYEVLCGIGPRVPRTYVNK